MEKLIELLNEYDSGWDYDDYYGPYQYGQDRDAYQYGKYYLVSRNYGFIKWLVDNNKIDFNFVERIGSGDFIYNMDSPYYNSCTCEDLKEYNDVDRVLMQLSIQDEPIEFLISILK